MSIFPLKDPVLDAYVRARVIEDGDCLRWTGSVSSKGRPVGSLPGRVHVSIRREIYADKRPIKPGHLIRCACEMALCVAHSRSVSRGTMTREAFNSGGVTGPVRCARIASAKRASSQSKITQDDARAIRSSSETQLALAERYGISPQRVSQIQRGTGWREYGAANPFAGLGA